jgi:NAD(P)H-dependent FMN reductase
MKILVIGGSSRREESRSNIVVDEVKKLFLEEAAVWKIAEKPLPLAEHAWHKNPSLSGDKFVIELAREIETSGIIILVSPIYNGSYTAHIKNALDCMDGAAFFGKTVVLVSVGSDSTAILPALHLQDVARTMGGFVYPRFTVINQRQINFENRTIDDDILNRIENIVSSAIKLNNT